MSGRKKRKRGRSVSVVKPTDVEAVSTETGFNLPFEQLGRLVKESGSGRRSRAWLSSKSERVRPTRSEARKTEGTSRAAGPGGSLQEAAGEAYDPEMELFLKAMEGVRPLEGRPERDEEAGGLNTGLKGRSGQKGGDDGALRVLEELVAGKRPIQVEKTPEYVQGPRINENPQIVRKLRRGKYAVQAYCDLHGFTAMQALEVCDEFMAESLRENRRCIAYIHGRGLSSKREPVLKSVVTDFLQKGRFRRWILAYSSAPPWDGGPGVTYVLLRKQPVRRSRRG